MKSRTKAILKTITWRIIASATTFILAMIFFREDPNATEKALGIAIIETVAKMVFYYYHERVWHKVTKSDTISDVTLQRREMRKKREEFCKKNWKRILGVDGKGRGIRHNKDLIQEAREYIGYSSTYTDGDMLTSLRVKANEYKELETE